MFRAKRGFVGRATPLHADCALDTPLAAAPSACWGEWLCRHRQVHHEQLEVVARAERVEGVRGAVGVGVAVAHRDGPEQERHGGVGLGDGLGG